MAVNLNLDWHDRSCRRGIKDSGYSYSHKASYQTVETDTEITFYSEPGGGNFLQAGYCCCCRLSKSLDSSVAECFSFKLNEKRTKIVCEYRRKIYEEECEPIVFEGIKKASFWNIRTGEFDNRVCYPSLQIVYSPPGHDSARSEVYADDYVHTFDEWRPNAHLLRQELTVFVQRAGQWIQIMNSQIASGAMHAPQSVVEAIPSSVFEQQQAQITPQPVEVEAVVGSPIVPAQYGVMHGYTTGGVAPEGITGTAGSIAIGSGGLFN
mmetsp:Transcript_20520/g.34339  ORF Transcript_20520/g.34339 Transcript_20520/m.34339 type:complete len:265 (+) Transcript_20520:106-900(+)